MVIQFIKPIHRAEQLRGNQQDVREPAASILGKATHQLDANGNTRDIVVGLVRVAIVRIDDDNDELKDDNNDDE